MLIQRLKGSRCYFAGPMDRVVDHGVGWRKIAAPFLRNLGIGVFDPTDKAINIGVETGDQREKRTFLKKQIAECLPEFQSFYRSQYVNIMKDIVSVDLRQIDLSDFVLMHVDMSVHSCGTYNEQAHACLQRKPLVVWVNCEPNEIPYHIPDWLYGHSRPEMFFNSLDRALAYIQYVHESVKEPPTYNRWKFFDYDKVYGRKL